MNYRSTLVLLVLLAAVGGGYLLIRTTGADSDDRLSRETNGESSAIPLVTGRGFTEIRIEQEGGVITLRREGDRWWQVEPVRFIVANEAVEAIINAGLSLAPNVTNRMDVSSVPSFADLGLDPPVATVTFISDTGTHTLHLGRVRVTHTAPVRKGEESAYYDVDATLHDLVLDARPATWRPGVLPAPPASSVVEMRLDRAGEAIRLTRTPDGWRFGEDALARADDGAAATLAALVGALELRSYDSDDPATLGRYGLVEPSVTFMLTTGTGDTDTLRLGRAADLAGERVYATWSDGDAPSPVVFTVDRAAVEPLMHDADTWRDARLVIADPATVRGLRIEREGGDTLDLSLRADGQGYVFGDTAVDFAPDTAMVIGWFRSLLDARADFNAPAPPESEPPLATVQLRLAGGRTERLRLYRGPEDEARDTLLAVREDELIGAVVPAEALAGLFAPRETLRERNTSSNIDGE